MSDIFEDKTTQSGDPDIKFSESYTTVGRRDDPVRTAQTLRQFYNSRRADDAMSVRNLSRPRRGHDY
jgi:hypothetical protein